MRPTDASPAPGRRRQTVIALLWLLPAVTLWWVSHHPCLELGFVGDDFQWWQHSRMAIAEPGLLLAPYGGYRPLNTWTMALDHLVYGTAPWGYHLTSLAWHLGCGLVLWAFLGRLGSSAPARGAAAALWLCSPFTLEPAQAVCERFEPALLAEWLALAVLWPRPGEQWRRSRVMRVALIAALTVLTKETWVVLPAFVVVFDLAISRRRWRPALRRGALVALAPLAYVALYFSGPPIAPGSFFGSGLSGALKIPHALAVFAGLTPLRPMEFGFGPAEAAATVAGAALGVLAWRWRSAAMALGFAFFLLPFLPVLPVGWMTSRYTLMPLAGFVTVVAATADELVRRLPLRARRATASGLLALASVVVATGLTVLRADLADARAFSAVHDRLVGQARAFSSEYPRGGAVVAVRLDDEEPLWEVSRALQGTAKTYFVRAEDPAGLIDWSALFSYVLDPTGGPLVVNGSVVAAAGAPFSVIGYSERGFARMPARAETITAEIAAWRAAGFTPRVLVPWHPRDH